MWLVFDFMDWYICVLSDFIKNVWWNCYWFRRFVDGMWYEDCINGYVFVKVYLSFWMLFYVVMYSIYVYLCVLFSMFSFVGISCLCMIYKSNFFFVI